MDNVRIPAKLLKENPNLAQLVEDLPVEVCERNQFDLSLYMDKDMPPTYQLFPRHKVSSYFIGNATGTFKATVTASNELMSISPEYRGKTQAVFKLFYEPKA